MTNRTRARLAWWFVGVLAAFVALPQLVLGQAGRITTMTRATSTTGLNDSTLMEVTDSARRTRAASLAQTRKALAVKPFDSLNTAGNLTVSGSSALQALSATTGAFSGRITSSVSNNLVLFANGSTTGVTYSRFVNSQGDLFFGIEGSAGGALGSGTSPYFAVFGQNGAYGVDFITSATRRGGFSAAGAFDVAGLSTLTGGATLGSGKRLTFAANDTVVGTVRLKDTLAGTPVWSSQQTFAAGQRVDSATGAARAPAGALTGSTLAAGVTASSLTSFGSGARTDSATGAARAQQLTTSRTLWGQSFNGTANVSGGLSSVTSVTYSTGTGAFHDASVSNSLANNSTLTVGAMSAGEVFLYDAGVTATVCQAEIAAGVVTITRGTGTCTGTSGTSGRINIYYSAGSIFVENKLGSLTDVRLFVIKLA